MEPDHPVLELCGPVPPGQVPSLAARLAERTGRGAVVRLSGTVDLGVLDVLARLALDARRRGVRLEVHGDEGLAGLLRLTGLGLAVQALGQAEAGEQGRVEEVVHVLHPPA